MDPVANGTQAVAAWDAWHALDPMAANSFADLMRGDLEDANARPDDDFTYLLREIERAREES